MRGRTRGVAASTPRAWRWTHVISAALSVVGTAATTRGRAERRADGLRDVDHPPAAERDDRVRRADLRRAGRPRGRRRARGRRAARAPPRRRARARPRPSARSSAGGSRSPSSPGASARAPRPKRIVRSPSRQVKSSSGMRRNPLTEPARRGPPTATIFGVLGRTYEGQDCSIARTLEVVGERWTLLVLRECFLGTARFDDFQRRLGIARNVLQARLAAPRRGGRARAAPLPGPPAALRVRADRRGAGPAAGAAHAAASGATATGRPTGRRPRSPIARCGGPVGAVLRASAAAAAVEMRTHRGRRRRRELTPLAPVRLKQRGRPGGRGPRRAEQGGPGAEQGHQVGSGVERVGDRAAAVQADRGAQLAVLLGDERLAGERGGVVERGEAA